ncbi:sugar phosphate isomerase/epimerase [Clostridium sp. DJ247]|uniref:sugar phosphate isomerase/epimerase family protein n=1 Tax=Clostridium sp. DJ247 TaxID=2726188 RepID=UPI0016296BE1|nr:TIM barrel protein [Clostridium sp. DJ247]MBC2581890.1 sugar phosphate isomerase/epimerase [Clostridium sp. DJ247]
MKFVYITTSAFGTKQVCDKGQQFYIPVIAKSGANGVEIREELITERDIPLGTLREVVKKERLECIYSAPVSLWKENGELNRELIWSVVSKAIELEAKIVKFSLGNFKDNVSNIEALQRVIGQLETEKYNLTLTIENDQTSYGGNLYNLHYFLKQCEKYNIPISMTFDVGNWNWTNEDPIEAAEKLSKYVVYIHFKHVDRDRTQLNTVPLPEAPNAIWRKVLAKLPQDALRAIEFPITGINLEEETIKYVTLLKNA